MKEKTRKPMVLAILDGWGVGPNDKTINAIKAGKTPFFDKVVEKYPYSQLGATGWDVGLEKDQMSGSEAGHLNIGAGRVVQQDVRIILEDIASGGFFRNPAFLSSISKVKKFKSNIHLMGLIGNHDSPHCHPDVFLALLILLKHQKMEGKVFFHLFTDGRDSFPKSALEHWEKWKKIIDDIGIGKLATVSGRFYAMDRVKNWDRLKKAYEAIAESKGERSGSFEEAVRSNYAKGYTDEYIDPTVIIENGKPVAKVSENDGVIFFNLRSDRARQFSKLFVGTKSGKDKALVNNNVPKNISFIAMTDFGPDLDLKTAYDSEPVLDTLPVVLSGLKQLYIAETEKFAHITYFINGGYSEPIGGEDRILINSPVVRSYAEIPTMAADNITEVVLKNIKYETYDFIGLNFANADMVGHTGDFKATVKAIEFLDKQLLKIHNELKKKNGILLITSDHGNADVMIEKKTGRTFTFHTKNPVPFVIVSDDSKINKAKIESGILANITPTLLDLLEIEQPEQMNQKSLILKR